MRFQLPPYLKMITTVQSTYGQICMLLSPSEQFLHTSPGLVVVIISTAGNIYYTHWHQSSSWYFKCLQIKLDWCTSKSSEKYFSVHIGVKVCQFVNSTLNLISNEKERWQKWNFVCMKCHSIVTLRQPMTTFSIWPLGL